RRFPHRRTPSINTPVPQPGSRSFCPAAGALPSNRSSTIWSTTSGGAGTKPRMGAECTPPRTSPSSPGSQGVDRPDLTHNAAPNTAASTERADLAAPPGRGVPEGSDTTVPDRAEALFQVVVALPEAAHEAIVERLYAKVRPGER